MRLEHYAENFVAVSEQEPSTTSNILSRFGYKSSVSEKKGLTHFQAAVLKEFLAGEGGLNFTHNSKECLHRNLVMTGSLLVGWTDPKQIERINGIYCGQTIKYEDREGPLCGRKGDVYKPLSHCWKTTIELARLVRFMKTKEEVPAITPAPDMNEENLKDLLNTRSEIRKRNEGKQMVFSTWNQIKEQTDYLNNLNQKHKHLALPSPKSEPSSQITITRKVYDATSQLDVGGPEYQEVTAWVENSVLKPLIGLVGKGNIQNYLVQEGDKWIIDLGFQKTARNCQNKPYEEFFGEEF